MIPRITRIASSDFSVLIAAGIASQALNLLAYPVLTYYYTPENFGLFSLITSVSTFAGAIALLRIETLYQIAPADEEPVLLNSALIVSILISIIVFIFSLLFGAKLFELLETNQDQFVWGWGYAGVCAIFAFFNGILSLGRQVWSKNEHYNRIAFSQIVRTVLTVGPQIILATLLYDSGSNGLIAGFGIGLTASAFIIWPVRMSMLKEIVGSPLEVLSSTSLVLNRYSSYIKVDVVNVIIRLSTLVAYPIFVLSTFGMAEAGLYAVASRLTFIPIDVLGVAMSTIYFQRLAKAVREQTGAVSLYLWTLLAAIVVSFSIAGMLAMTAGPLVNYIFGDEWTRTGVIILCLLPTFLSRFVTVCIGSTPIALKRPEILLVWNVVQLVIIALSLWLSLEGTLEDFLLYSGVSLMLFSTIYAAYLLIVLFRLKAPETQ
jgi:O-antigen/teichoic acid export membrane protein